MRMKSSEMGTLSIWKKNIEVMSIFELKNFPSSDDFKKSGFPEHH